MAYLALHRLRYREEIHNFTCNCIINKLDGGRIALHDMKVTGTNLAWLADVSKGDAVWRYPDLNLPDERERPNVFWAWLYEKLFMSGFDRYMVASLCVASFVFLLLGAAHSIGYMAFSYEVFNKSSIHWWLWGAVLCAVFPGSMAIIGRLIVNAAEEYIKDKIQTFIEGRKSKAKEVGFTGRAVADGTVADGTVVGGGSEPATDTTTPLA